MSRKICPRTRYACQKNCEAVCPLQAAANEQARRMMVNSQGRGAYDEGTPYMSGGSYSGGYRKMPHSVE